jgi:hypothetical protein
MMAGAAFVAGATRPDPLGKGTVAAVTLPAVAGRDLALCVGLPGADLLAVDNDGGPAGRGDGAARSASVRAELPVAGGATDGRCIGSLAGVVA